MRNKCSFLFFYGGRRKGEDEGGGLRCGWLLVEIQKKEKKRKRKDETKGPATPHMENVSLFRVKFSPIKYYIKEEKRRVKNGATRV
tara:strand:- start:2346 stop:2603 length:258 start_codon:yes stop_codon:yes gene_type:complete